MSRPVAKMVLLGHGLATHPAGLENDFHIPLDACHTQPSVKIGMPRLLHISVPSLRDIKTLNSFAFRWPANLLTR
jgi:hypothetical protein